MFDGSGGPPPGPGPGGPRGGFGPPPGGFRGPYGPPPRHGRGRRGSDDFGYNSSNDLTLFPELSADIRYAKLEKGSILKGTIYGVVRYFKRPFDNVKKNRPVNKQKSIFYDADFHLGWFEDNLMPENAEIALDAINKIEDESIRKEMMERYNAAVNEMNGNDLGQSRTL